MGGRPGGPGRPGEGGLWGQSWGEGWTSALLGTSVVRNERSQGTPGFLARARSGTGVRAFNALERHHPALRLGG